jgi:hypothetical protein
MTGVDAQEAIAAAFEVRLGSNGCSDAVGVVGPDIPIELLLASGRPFGHLPWGSNDATPWADCWLESSFPYWARSILEQWHAGLFDSVDTVVFSRADDASQRLYYYVAEQQTRGLLGGPVPRVLDIALQRRDSSVSHTADAIVALCRALDVAPAALPAAIARANRLRRVLADLERERTSNGALYERLGRLALWTDPTRWIFDIAIPALPAGRARVLLAGSVPPDDRLHRAVEATGASIVGDAHVHGLTRLGPELALDAGSPERQIALQVQQASIGPRATIDRARWLVERCAAARAAAVIVWLTREDEALAWHVPEQRRALAAAGIPVLMLPAARWQADDDTLERIAAFCTETLHATA